MNPLLIPELRELIADQNAKELREFLESLLPAQAAELIEGLSPKELSWALSILDAPQRATIFEYLPEDHQLTLASGVARQELAQLLNTMAHDDRAEFVRRLPPRVVEEILPLMAQADRNDVKRMLSFAEGTIGCRMTTDYAHVEPHLTLAEALAKVRHEAPDKETIYSIYVLDKDRHLEGVVGLKELLLGKPDALVDNVMRKEAVTVRSDESEAEAARRIKKYDLLALPVVDDAGRLLGIVTVDDLMDVIEREATEDILSLGGVEPGALDRPYFENPVFHVVKKRVGWLLLLFVAEMFTGTVLRHFDEALAKVVALSFFIPLLIGTGGNCGSQTVSTIIRSFALGEIKTSDWLRVLGRESVTGLVLGLMLGVVGVLRSYMWAPDWQLAGTVGITIVAICVWSNAIAALVPILAQRVGLDPTVLSAPLITTLVDATGLLIYFSIANTLITRLSEPAAVLAPELVQKVMDVAKEAPPALAEKLTGLVQPDTSNTHANEWLFPLLALCALSLVLFSFTRRSKPHAA